ncbi:hypothetical protein ACWFQ8_09390 [Streptomyces sp. NPDC055254]
MPISSRRGMERRSSPLGEFLAAGIGEVTASPKGRADSQTLSRER